MPDDGVQTKLTACSLWLSLSTLGLESVFLESWLIKNDFHLYLFHICCHSFWWSSTASHQLVDRSLDPNPAKYFSRSLEKRNTTAKQSTYEKAVCNSVTLTRGYSYRARDIRSEMEVFTNFLFTLSSLISEVTWLVKNRMFKDKWTGKYVFVLPASHSKQKSHRC